MNARKTHHELEPEILYWTCDEDIGPIKAGSPIALSQNGADEVRISDWSDPREVHHNRVSMFDVTMDFTDGIELRGYIADDIRKFDHCHVNLKPFQPLPAPAKKTPRGYTPVEPLASMSGSNRKLQHLKTWPKFFDAIERGDKTFEIRENDRPFAVGTKLVLHEYDPDAKAFTGRVLERVVTYITDWEQKPRFVVMGIKPLL